MKKHTIGSLQKKILAYLAKHPDEHHRKGIQIGLEEEEEKKLRQRKRVRIDYHSVYSAIEKLHNIHELIEFRKEETTEKGNVVPLWRLSELGVAFVLTDLNIDYKTLRTFIKKYPDSQVLKILGIFDQVLGKEALENFREFTSSVYSTVFKQLKKGVITKEQMMPTIFSSLFTYLLPMIQDLGEDVIMKLLVAFVEEGTMSPEFPDAIKEYVRLIKPKESERKG